MRIIPVVVAVLVLVSPGSASAQNFEVHGSAGPTITDAGYSVAAGLGFSPASRVTFALDVERTHLPSRVRTYPEGVTSFFRGGTVTLAVAALRVSLFGRDRVGPYALVGLGAGVSRPNVTEVFPSRVTNSVNAPFFGGGFQVPLGDRVSVFAEARLMLVVGREVDEVFAVAPIRGGIAWHF